MVYTDENTAVPIDEVRKDAAIDITPEMVENGFIWRIEPYADHILPIYAHAPEVAYARVEYVIQPANGGPIPSKPETCFVSIAGSATETCDLTRP